MTILESLIAEIQADVVAEEECRRDLIKAANADCRETLQRAVQMFLPGVALGAPEKKDDNRWVILVEELLFEKYVGRSVLACTLLPPLCSHGCKAYIQNREDLKRLICRHLSLRNKPEHVAQAA